MAQLPPKFPSNISTIPPASWPSFNHPRLPSMSSFFLSSPSTAPPASSWVDEFFDFTSFKRGSHRRAISDTITFFQSAPGPPGATHAVAAAASFDGLDEEQLMSMFSDDLQPPSSAPPSTSPSTPSSDPNSISDQDKQTPPNSSSNDQSEAQSASNNAETPLAAVAVSATMTTLTAPKTTQPIVDPKRVKRILANRQSAQRSRVRKLQYITELEKSVTTLESEVSALSPRVAFLDHQRSVLSVGNSQLKQRIAALAQDKIFKDAHKDALQNEIERLRQVYHRQNLKKMAVVAGVRSDGPVIHADKKLNIPAGTDHDPSTEC